MASRNALSILVLVGLLAACDDAGLSSTAEAAAPGLAPATAGDSTEEGAGVAMVWTRGGRVLLRRPEVTGTVE